MTSTDSKRSQRDQSRVVCYVDGFNLYHGLRSRGWRKYYWLDVWALAERFLKLGQILMKLVFGTARIKDDPDGLARQLAYLDALQSHRSGVEVVYGQYLSKQARCLACGPRYVRHEEKMTDVNLACRLLIDAMDDHFDVAMVISADGDLIPPVEVIRDRWPERRVIVIYPPGRWSDALKRVAHGRKRVGEADPRQRRLPEIVSLSGGRFAEKPLEWR